MTSYPLTLTVEYEENSPEAVESSWTAPHGFAVIRLGTTEVRREPLDGSPYDGRSRDGLERAAALWLARVTAGQGRLG